MLETWIKEEIIKVCKNHCKKVILFGSRARGDNSPTSDIDLALLDCDDFDYISSELKYNEFTLLLIDIIDLNAQIDTELKRQIERDGVILYEQ